MIKNHTLGFFRGILQQEEMVAGLAIELGTQEFSIQPLKFNLLILKNNWLRENAITGV